MIALALFLLLPQAPTVTPKAETAKAAIRGHAYGVDNGAPLKRATVMLRSERGRQGAPMTVSTDGQGAFEFRNLDAGSYSISCTKTGFVTSSYGPSGFNQSGGGRSGSSVAVTAGE